MKCRDCRFLSKPETFGDNVFPSVRCTLGVWDDDELGCEQWYAYGSSQLNRGPVKRHGAACTQGKPKS